MNTFSHLKLSWRIRLPLILFFICAQLCANAQFRKYSNEFLNIGAGARGLAMGGAQVASVQDATAGYWNPAGLVGVEMQPSVSFMHAEYFAGIGKFDFGSIALPLYDKKRTLAFSFLRFAVDDIPNTLFLVEPDGSINYNNITSFSSADYAFILSYAQKLKISSDRKMSFGVNAKIIHRRVGAFATAWGFGLDGGWQMQGKRWSVGVAARDITTTFNAWSFQFTEREKEILYLTNNNIPVQSTELTAPRLIIGAAYDFPLRTDLLLKAEANLEITFDGKRNTLLRSGLLSADPRIGAELSLKDQFFVRAGVYNFQQALADGDTLNQKKVWIYQPGAGAGFRLGKSLMIDYAFTNLANQANPLYTHIFSVRLELINKKRGIQQL